MDTKSQKRKSTDAHQRIINLTSAHEMECAMEGSSSDEFGDCFAKLNRRKTQTNESSHEQSTFVESKTVAGTEKDQSDEDFKRLPSRKNPKLKAKQVTRQEEDSDGDFDTKTRTATKMDASSQEAQSEQKSVWNLPAPSTGTPQLSEPGEGPIIGALLVLLTGCGSSWTIYILISCGRRTGAQSYEGIAQHVYGRWPQLGVTFLVLISTYICMVAYTIFLQGIVGPILQSGFGGHLSVSAQLTVLELILVLAAPLCLPSKIRYLNFTATLNVIGVVLLAVILIIKAQQACKEGPFDGMIPPLKNRDPSAYLDNGVPIIICSFLCHFNVLPVHNSLHRPTRRRLKRIVHWTLTLTSILYLFIGLSGYFYGKCSGHGIEANIFSSFRNDDTVANVGRVALFVVIFFSYPYFVVPCRASLTDLLRIWNEDDERLISNLDDGRDFSRDTDMTFSRNVSSEYLSLFEDRASVVLDKGKEALVVEESEEGDGGDRVQDKCAIGDKYACKKVRNCYWVEKVTSLTKDPTNQDIMITLVLLSSQLLVAAVVPQVNIWWNILGSFVTVTLVFIFPCAAYIKLRGHSNRRKKWRGTMRWLAAHVVLSVSVMVMLVCSLYSVLEWMFL